MRQIIQISLYRLRVVGGRLWEGWSSNAIADKGMELTGIWDL